MQYLSECFHLLQVSAAKADPASPAIGVVHFLSWNPRFRPTVRRDGDAILPP